MPLVESDIKALIISMLELSNSLMSFVVQLPRQFQITFGGNPKKATRLFKSLSFVTIVNISFLANSQTIESLATSRLRSCKCFEHANDFAKKLVSLGERFWSNRSFIRRKVQFFLCLQHSSNRQVYLLFPGRGSLQEFLQNSYLKQGSLTHQLRLFAFPSHRVYHLFSRIPKLFFHLVTWQNFFPKNTKKIEVIILIWSPFAWYAMHKWLQNFACKTELSWWIFALAGVLALGIALLTVSFQSWKAATRNPVESLRYY